ncbi:MAG: pantetheine-phosphate adenylyltransferase [Candidatus Marinamargulisbacteria bacterium]|jgi:pantetheine-phosphate adenylyltransferase|nr:pantetheine-phosphate adenylyltransferase [Candidatus Marinamargulisbacteria bacterium]
MSIAIYAGSFDPITKGHVDIVIRANQVFETIVVLVMQHSQKMGWLPLEQRVTLVKETFASNPMIEVATSTGLLAQYAKKRGIKTLIRGLRAVSDFDYEAQMALANRDLYPGLDTVFFMTSKDYAYLSSSIVREMVQHQAPVAHLVPAPVQGMIES